MIVGTLVRPVGLRGEIEVLVHSDDPRRFVPGSRLLLAPDLNPITVESARRHHGRTVVRFAGIGDRGGAEVLSGRDLLVLRDDARTLSPDEYWDDDLVGCRVVTRDGAIVGTVTDVIHGPTQDTLEVGSKLIPLVAAIVREVVPDERRIVIDPPPGLLD